MPESWRLPVGSDHTVQAVAQRETVRRMSHRLDLTPLLCVAAMCCNWCGGPPFTRQELAAMPPAELEEAIDDCMELRCASCQP